jgi:hypothetical protein
MRSTSSWIPNLFRSRARRAPTDGRRWFAVDLEGANLLTRIDDQPMRVGFFKTMYVEAADDGSAADAAKGRVTEELTARALNDPADPPRLMVEAVNEIAEEDLPDVEPGYAFYPDVQVDEQADEEAKG